MIKKKRFIIAIALIFCFLFFAGIALAVDDSVTTEKTIEVVGGIELHSAYYPLDNYQGHINSGKTQLVVNAVSGIGGAIFYLTKLIWSGFDYIIEFTNTSTFLLDSLDIVFPIAKNLWTNLSNEFLGLIIVIVAGTLVYHLFGSVSPKAIFQTILSLVIVYMISVLFVNYGSTLVKEIVGLKNKAESSIVSVATGITNRKVDVPQGQEQQATTTMIRNSLFDITIYRPYLAMNYGTVNEDDILKDDDNRIHELLSIIPTEEGEKASNKIVKKEAKELKNINMSGTPIASFSKLGIGFISFIVVIAVGIPFLILSVLRFLYELMVLTFLLVLAISLIMSLIPKYRLSWIKAFSKVIGNLFSTTLVAIYSAIFILILGVVDTMIKPEGTSSYLANSIIFACALWYVLMKREELVDAMTGGKISLASTRQTEGIGRKVSRMRSQRHIRNIARNRHSEGRPEKKGRFRRIKKSINRFIPRSNKKSEKREFKKPERNSNKFVNKKEERQQPTSKRNSNRTGISTIRKNTDAKNRQRTSHKRINPSNIKKSPKRSNIPYGGNKNSPNRYKRSNGKKYCINRQSSGRRFRSYKQLSTKSAARLKSTDRRNSQRPMKGSSKR